MLKPIEPIPNVTYRLELKADGFELKLIENKRNNLQPHFILQTKNDKKMK